MINKNSQTTQTEQPIKKNKLTKITVIGIAIIIALNIFKSCGGTSSDKTLKANNWYHNDLVSFQNCVITSCTASGSSVSVWYEPICKDCHQKINDFHLNIGEVTSTEPLLRYCTCSECNTVTKVTIKLY